MIQTSYQQWVIVLANLGVPTCCPLHLKKPNTTYKPSNVSLTFGAYKHGQKTKHVYF